MANGLTIQPLLGQGVFNWVFLVEILVCGLLALFFLFYSNRLFATIVAYCVRAWTWHKYRAYIDVQALQISLLGGRIFFKSISYRAHNITLLIHEGHITWRYWLRLVQDADVFLSEEAARQWDGDGAGESRKEEANQSLSEDKENEKIRPRSRSLGKEENAGIKPKKELPCRISVKVAAVEAFIYNRSPVYDIVLEQTMKHAREKADSTRSDTSDKLNSGSGSGTANGNDNEKLFESGPQLTATRMSTGVSSIGNKSSHSDTSNLKIPSFLHLLPVRVECKRAAAALGNENTKCIIVAKAEKAVGKIDAGKAGSLDLYKLLFDFDIEDINVAIKPNRDYKEPQLDAARRTLREEETIPPPALDVLSDFIRTLRSPASVLSRLFGRRNPGTGSLRTTSIRSYTNSKSAGFGDRLPDLNDWQGLARYLDDQELNEHDEWRDVEYAKASTIAELDRLHLRFYFDMPGVAKDNSATAATSIDSCCEEDINGSRPPDYGMDLLVHGGTVTYGPWADRQRLDIQPIFFPAPYVDAVQRRPLKLGETREWSTFKIFVSIEEEVTLRIPSRESSKDSKWQGRAKHSMPTRRPRSVDSKRRNKYGRKRRHTATRKNKQGNPTADARPYAWLDVTVKPNSTINYVMDMFPGSMGYRNKLSLDIKATEIESSVNHAMLWRTGAIVMSGDLSQPLPWNSLRKWPFDVEVNDLELFILRDHFFLIIDLVNDWSAGALSEFYTFVPYVYTLRLLFRNFIIYLNVNDSNIVNDPVDLDKNDFLTLEGLLDSTLDISMEHYRPVRNWITFDVLATDMRMRMLSPSRSAYSTLLRDKQVATLPKLTLSGSYSGHIEERLGLTDTLRFDIVGSGLCMKAYGFLVRQLISVKENYFGDYLHFKTLEEFQSTDDDLQVANVKTASIPKPTTINELDVILCIVADDITVMFPTNLFSCDTFVRAEVPLMNLDLRILSYYLDMGLQLSPLSLFAGNAADEAESMVDASSSAQLYVKHLDLDGHRAFGPPPDEPAYLNQWTIDVGGILGELSSSFVHNLALGAQAFIFGFLDRENALPLDSPTIFDDATFVQVRTDIVKLWFHAGNDAFLLSTDPIEVATNNLADDTFSQRVSLMAPKITFACVDRQGAVRSRLAEGVRTNARTYGFLQTGVAINVVERKANFAASRMKQQAYLRENDRRTQRVAFMLRKGDRSSPQKDNTVVRSPAMQYPFIPQSLEGENSLSDMSSISAASSIGPQSRSSTSSLSASISKRQRRTIAFQPTEGSQQEHLDPRTLVQITPSSNCLSSPASSDRRGPRASLDSHRDAPGALPTSVTFSSSYLTPHFPLEDFEPDESDVPSLEEAWSSEDSASESSSLLGQIEDPEADETVAKTSIIIRVEPGIRVYAEPRLAIALAIFADRIFPRTPDEVMDAFEETVLSTVAAQQQKRHPTAHTLELNIDVPSAVFRVLVPSAEGQPRDCLQVGLHSVSTMVRMGQQVSVDGRDDVLAVHLVTGMVETSLGRYNRESSEKAAFEANIIDVLCYVAVASTQSVNASVRETTLSISSEHAEYMTDVAFRLLPLIDEGFKSFEDVFTSRRKRLLVLISALTQHSHSSSDPTYLSRVTYLLRAFPDHFRNDESWKLISRLRYSLHTLPADVLSGLQREYDRKELDCSQDEFVRSLKDWSEIRNWDVPNITQTAVFHTLVPEDNASMSPSFSQKPLVLSVRSEYLRVAIDTGEQVNEVAIEDISLAVERSPPTAPTGLMLVEENTREKVQLQMHVSSIALSINWSLFGIVELILPLRHKLQRLVPTPRVTPRSKSERLEDSLMRRTYQVVVSTDSGSISLQSINLRHVSKADGMRLAIVGTTHIGGEYGLGGTIMLNADAAVTELHGASRRLWSTLLTSPSIYCDFVCPTAASDVPQSSTIAVAYKDLLLSTTEPPPGLINIIDCVVVDEMAKVMKLVESIRSSTATDADVTRSKVSTGDQPPSTIPIDAASKPIKFHLALLAGNLEVEISLLQALKYRLTGRAASFRVAPSLFHEKSWSIDFDVGDNHHCFVNSSSNQTHLQSILDVPPVNGHVGIDVAPESTSLSVAVTVERVEVDAAAIQGVLSVLNRPEVQGVISNVTAQVEDIKSHSQIIRPDVKAAETSIPVGSKFVAFDVRFALLGIRVAAITPVLGGAASAEVEFGVGPVHAIASNRLESSHGIASVPEVRVQIKDIGAKLLIRKDAKVFPAGNVSFGLYAHFKECVDESTKTIRELNVVTRGMEIDAYPDTASIIVDIINHLQDRIKTLDLSKEAEYLRRLRDHRKFSAIRKVSTIKCSEDEDGTSFSAIDLLSVATTIEIADVQIAWLVDQSYAANPRRRVTDLVFSVARVEFTTRGGNQAKLAFADVQLQLAKRGTTIQKRTLNSAILPDVSFTVSYYTIRKNVSFALKAAGKPLEIRLDSNFVYPVSAVQGSIEDAIQKVKAGTIAWENTPTTSGAPRGQIFDVKRLEALLVEADFAGARVYLQRGGAKEQTLSTLASGSQQRGAQHGRYGQFATEGVLMQAELNAPGIAVKVEYNSFNHEKQPTLNGEVRVDASSNMVLPNVVPLILEVSQSVKDVVQSQKKPDAPQQRSTPASMDAKSAQRFFEDDKIIAADPIAIFGKTKVDLGLRICRQEFGLTCQPIARVDAKAYLGDFYITMNTIDSDEHGHFFAVSAVVTDIGAQVKHMYSREPTLTYEMDSIMFSVLNNKHLSGTNGISAILKLNPTKISINGKQFQDLLLFREIWLPPELRVSQSSQPSAQVSTSHPEDHLVSRYQAVAAAAAFPWNANVQIAELNVDVDLGQSIGKSSFKIKNLWGSQVKSSDREQNLCIGLEDLDMTSTGRMSGFVRLHGFGVRTSIRFSEQSRVHPLTPIIQGSAGFDRLLAKAAFDYQAFAFGDIEGFDFLMYNVREGRGSQDRLVAVLDCEKAYVFCTSTSPAQSVGLYQAFDRLIQEKQAAYTQSLRDIEKHLRRESTIVPTRFGPQIRDSPLFEGPEHRTSISLHTDVVLTIGAISFGVFPSTFFDTQILTLEANNIQTRFAVGLERGRIHSGLGMTLGQLQVALAAVRGAPVPKTLDVSVDDVVSSALNAKGGTILRVPKVVASMQTWQTPDDNNVDYIFKSLFDGKIDVGWNLSRINFIKGMWTNHSRALATRLGKALPESAVKITAGPNPEATALMGGEVKAPMQEKITAEINLPQSRYEYHALETPIIETPQLRDMGEATPPLEWIGLHRDRLPNVTHQIIIVSLVEVAKEVEDAYEKILGTSAPSQEQRTSF